MNPKIVVLFIAYLICVAVATIVHLLYATDIVYTHLFYIPIIMTAVWYPRYAVFMAVLLGLTHIFIDYRLTGAFKISPILRTAVFITVASVTAYLAMRLNRLIAELRTINTAMLDMVSELDDKGIVLYVSPSVKKILGYDPEQITGKEWFSLIHPDDAQTVKRSFQSACVTQTHFRTDLRCRHADGSYLWMETLCTPLPQANKGMTIYVFGSRDITQRKHIEEKLKHLSIHDSLTGLHNRYLFEEEIRRFSTGRFDPVSVLICDLDGLKLVNDELGHDVGDRMLIAAADLLKSHFRASDVVARIGGDEFAVLLANCGQQTMESIHSRLKQELTELYIDGSKIPLMMSIGFATRNNNECSIEQLLKEADDRMYEEKFKNREEKREILEKAVAYEKNKPHHR